MIVAADPYPWPYDEVLETSQLALVIAGDQESWFSHSWQAAAAATVIEAVSSAVRAAGGLVLHVRSPPAAGRHDWGSSAPTAGADAWKLVAPPSPGDLEVEAAGIDGFYGSSLDHLLRSAGVRHLAFAGYGAEATVSSTLRSANDRGYECLTLVDAVAPLDPMTGHHSLSTITMSGGVFGAVAPAAALIAALRSSVLTAMEAIS